MFCFARLGLNNLVLEGEGGGSGFGGDVELGVVHIPIKADVFAENVAKGKDVDDEEEGPQE